MPKAAGVSDIADLLEQRGVVSSSTLFEVRATLAGDRGNLKPGSYELREDMPYGDVLDRLTAGPSQEIVRVTIPEGLSRREITPLVARAGVNGNYLRASASTSLIDGRGYAVPAGAESLEGFLFPATYELRGGAQAAALVRRQITAFEQNISRVDLAYARGKNLTVYDVVTIASMIEREVQVARERRLVAAVIYNRLKAGQPLGIDATIRYATGNWTAAAEAERAGDRLRLQHAHPRRASAGPDREPRARVAAGGSPPGPRRLPLLRRQAGHMRGARVLLHGRGVRPRPAALQRGARRGRREVPNEMLKRVALLGHPVGHSRSPAMHNAAFRELGLDWRYEALDVEPAGFAGVLESLPGQGFVGANVTIPHKLRALEAADEPTEVARVVGAANTLSFQSGRVLADNTDVEGFLTALRERAPSAPAGMNALVLGAGGAGRAVVYALLSAGAARVEVWNRHPERAEALVSDLAGTAGKTALQSAAAPSTASHRPACQCHVRWHAPCTCKPRTTGGSRILQGGPPFGR